MNFGITCNDNELNHFHYELRRIGNVFFFSCIYCTSDVSAKLLAIAMASQFRIKSRMTRTEAVGGLAMSKGYRNFSIDKSDQNETVKYFAEIFEYEKSNHDIRQY